MAAHQAPPSLGFFRQEHWSGLPFPSPLYEAKTKLWWEKKKIRTGIISAEGSEIDSKEIPGPFWNDSNVLGLNRFLGSQE